MIGDEGQLTFVLQRECVKLPIWLGASTLPRLGCPLHLSNRAVFPLWLGKFDKLPILPPFMALCREADPDIPVGLIFPRKGFQQGLILHSGGQDYIASRGSAIVWRDNGRELIVQSLATFVAHLKELIA